MNMSMKVELLVGTSIENASIEACRVATHLGINVSFDFNGMKCIAQPNSLYVDLINSYHEELELDKRYRIATSRSKF